MWTLDDVSGVDASAMDGRRSNPSYEAGFDLCDPLGSVIWSDVPGRSAGRVLRRRCRSEGVDRSPYEDATREPLRSAEGYPRHRAQPNKSFFTLNNSPDRYVRECSLPTSNGDYLMAHEQNRYHGYQPARSKFNRTSPSRPLLVTTLSNTKVDDSRLPKVEELLEKIDQDMMELNTKIPLKSILNNPTPLSPPPGILKKPKGRIYQDPILNLEGRRRQRASSESDNLYCSFNLSPIPGYDHRLAYLSHTNKRAKDNSGTGYSYGTAIATLGTTPRVTSPVAPKRCVCKEAHQLHSIEQPDTNTQHMHLLRTTAITNEKRESRQDTPTPTCPAVSPGLPVSSVTSMPVPKKVVKSVKKKKQKVTLKVKPSVIDKRGITTDEDKAVRAKSVKEKRKKKVARKVKPSVIEKRRITTNGDTHRSRSPSPDALKKATWRMETDTLIELVNKVQPRSVKSSDVTESVSKVSSKSNGLLTNGSVTSEPVSSLNGLTTSDTCSTGASNGDVANGRDVTPKVISKEITSLEQSFMAALHTTNPFKVHSVRKDAILHLPDSISSCLRKSLFPRVPPYLKFVGHDEPANSKLPLAIQKHLKWKMTTITPIVVKKTLTNSGFRIVKSECDTAECPQEETVDWIGIWGKHMKSLMFRAIKDGQKMNHFPGTFQIGRKDRLWRNLQKLVVKYGKKEFGIMPKTYVLPHDIKLLKHDWDRYAANNEKWIIKPPASARGTGIKVVSRWTQIPKKRPVVVQRYVSKPYLINGNKFDMRLYVLVTSVHPLRIYLFKDGLARFASVKYNDELASLNDRYMHLTNYSINRLSKNYTPNEDFAATEGHKWTLQTLFQYLRGEKNVDTDALWDSIKDLVVKTIISGEASISSLTKANITSRYNCYELFGIDVLLDEHLKPWLLEVNISPSLHSASPLDIHVKGPLVSCVLNIAQFQVPLKVNLDALSKEKPSKLVSPKATETVPEEKTQRLTGLPYDSRLYTVYLSKEERDKHIIYTNMEERDMYLRDILSTLTPDDVRHLIQAEDELSQAGEMERIFPTRETHRYLAFLAGPRYYNRLFDAWETRYGQYREPGLELLRNLCDIGYHLEVPPVPLKVRVTPRRGTLLTLGNEWVNYEKDELDTDLPCHENDVDAPSPEASERPSVPSLGSVESCGPALVARPGP